MIFFYFQMSFMANPGLQQPIDTLDDLLEAVKHRGFKFTTIRNSALENYLRSSMPNCTDGKLWSLMARQWDKLAILPADIEQLRQIKNNSKMVYLDQLGDSMAINMLGTEK